MTTKLIIQVNLTLTLTLALTYGADVTRIDSPCPYKECSCDASYIDCRNKGLTTLPVLTNGSFTQTTLDISYNNISTIPGGQLLPGLVEIICSHNVLVHISDDAFTASTHTLQLLHLVNNDITLPPDLSYLTHLWYLDLGVNNISHIPSLPDSLQHLLLWDNAFTVLPPRVSTLTQLTHLELGSNTIKDIDTVIFPSSLQQLDLSFNKLENISTFLFTNNTSNLTELDLYDNPLTSVSKDAFSQLSQLTDLDLSSTRLTSLPLALMTLTHLTNLDLSHNPDMTCTCDEAGLAAWYRDMTSLTVEGKCDSGNTVVYFLTKVAPKCPTVH